MIRRQQQKVEDERTREVPIIPRQTAVKYLAICRKKSSGRQITIFVKSCRRSPGFGSRVQKTEDYHGFLICVQTPLIGLCLERHQEKGWAR